MLNCASTRSLLVKKLLKSFFSRRFLDLLLTPEQHLNNRDDWHNFVKVKARRAARAFGSGHWQARYKSNEARATCTAKMKNRSSESSTDEIATTGQIYTAFLGVWCHAIRLACGFDKTTTLLRCLAIEFLSSTCENHKLSPFRQPLSGVQKSCQLLPSLTLRSSCWRDFFMQRYAHLSGSRFGKRGSNVFGEIQLNFVFGSRSLLLGHWPSYRVQLLRSEWTVDTLQHWTYMVVYLTKINHAGLTCRRG